MNTTHALLGVCGLATAACATPFNDAADRDNSSFDLRGEEFTFATVGHTVGRGPEDLSAEAQRIGWLEHHMHLSDACGDGYKITGRRVANTVKGPLGQGYRITYKGRCGLTPMMAAQK
jgi:hypothetical protein